MALEISIPKEVELVEAFTINGEPFYIPNQTRLNLFLEYSALRRKEGDESASVWLTEQMLGEENYKKLCSYDGITEEQFKAIMNEVRLIVLGETEAKLSGKVSGRKTTRK